MTVTLPDTDTDTARQIFEAPEVARPCEHPEGCAREADWIVRTRNACGCRFVHLICDTHKRALDRQIEDPTPRRWTCYRCADTVGPGPFSTYCRCDSEPLR